MVMEPYGGYVTVDWGVDGYEVEPLLFCLRFAISDRYPVDFFLNGIILGSGPAGGDPGWQIDRVVQPNGETSYVAQVSEVHGLDPRESTYSQAVFDEHVRRTLGRYAQRHPEAAREVEHLIHIYGL